MKKGICLLLTVVLSISLCACGGSKNVTTSVEELASYINANDVTTDNWENYFELIEEEEIEKDSFGEEINRVTKHYLALKEGYYPGDVVLRVTYVCTAQVWSGVGNGVEPKDVEETKDFQFYFPDSKAHIYIAVNMSDELIVKNVQCIKSKGTVATITIPDEKWNIDENGKKYLYIEDNGEYCRLYEVGSIDGYNLYNEILNILE